MSRISIKIICSIVLSVFIVAITIGAISSSRAAMIIQEETYLKFQYMATSYANRFSLLLSEVETAIHTLSSTVTSDFKTDDFRNDINYRSYYMNKTNGILLDIILQNTSIQGIYLAINPEITGKVYESWYINNGNENFIYQEPEDISTFYPENENMKWYYDPIRTGEGVWSMPYTDATINIKMISYTKAIYAGKQLIGVAGIDLSFNDIFKTISEIVLYDSGYGILTDSSYHVIVHPELQEGTDISKLQNENFKSVINSLKQNNTDVLLYKYRNIDKIMGFSKLTNDWVFLAVADLADINTPVKRLRQVITVIVIIVILFGAAVGLSISKSITGQLNILHEMTDRIGNGNFKLPSAPETNDEIGNLARSFRVMSQKLEASQKDLLELNNSMKILAFHDPLTRLPNRRYGMDALEKMVNNYNAENFDICGIMSIDLDNFKDINDTKGHDVGDKILIQTSEMMNHQISSHDLLCRIGGDEFLLLFRKVPSVSHVEAMAKRILNAVKEPVLIDSCEIHSGCSIGIAILDTGNNDIDKILKNADLALYSVKKSGRNNYCLYTDDSET